MANRHSESRHWARRPRWIWVIAILAAFVAGCLTAERAAASKLDDLDTSLKWIPDDAAFYSSMLRNREQIEAIAGSRAWAKLKSMPIVQMGLMMYQLQAGDPESVPGQIEATRKNPQVSKLIDLACDMGSEEIFLYGDRSFIDFLELLQVMVGTMQYGPAMAQLSGQSEGLDPDELQMTIMMSALAENIELVKVPDAIVGFKLSNTDRAKEQLAEFEQMATPILEADPVMKGRLKRTKVGGDEFLTLSLDGTMVPWDEVPLDELKEAQSNEGDVDKLIARLKKITLVIALGVRDDYLLLSIGSSTECLTRLGRGRRLIDRPELAPLEKFADRRLVSVGYVSKTMMMNLANSKEDIDDLLEMVDAMLPLAELEPDQTAQIRKDAAALAEDLKGMLPEPGAVMAFSFLDDRGIEGYTYNWGENASLDGSKPLGLLQHVGGNPLLAAVARGKSSPESYDLMVKWIKVGWGYVQQYAVPEMSGDDRKEFEQFVKLALPLAKRADNANRKMLIPALADGQVGLVVDAKLTSEQFLEALPPTEQPMPMIEPALVLGVSDAKLLLEACREYRAVINGVVDLIRQTDPGTIPDDFKIPEPKVTKSASGTIYGWALPKEWGVDEKITPNLGLSATVAVASISREHTSRLLSVAPLAAGGVLSGANRPLASAGVFDWAGLIDAATPWIDFAVVEIIKAQGGGESDAITAQVHTVLDVLKVIRTITSESYFEGDALVTHSLVEIRDVEP